MHIIIIGGGGVGYELARNLSGKNQDVAVIEKDPERVPKLVERLDVIVIEGNGASVSVLEKAGIRNAEMVIAVTQIDEVNIIACLLAKRLGVKITVARIRDSEYVEKTGDLIEKHLGIDMVINPEKVAAAEITKMIHFPDASDIEYFAQGKVMMLGMTADEEMEITGQSLQDLSLSPGCIVVGIKRPGSPMLIPSGKDSIKPGDKIYLQGSAKVLSNVSWLLHHEETQVDRVTILGGGRIGSNLAVMLEKERRERPYSVKLIEKDPTRCEELSLSLSRALVLQGDATDLSFFRDEAIEDADVLVSATGDDRTNILTSIYGKQLGVKKIISEASNLQYVSIFQTLGIESVISPHLLTAAQILRYTRKEEVVSLTFLKDENAEMLELILPASARVVGQKIANAGLPRGMLIGAIVRGEKIIVPHGDTVMEVNDRLVVFAVPRVSSELGRFFAGQQEKNPARKRWPF